MYRRAAEQALEIRIDSRFPAQAKSPYMYTAPHARCSSAGTHPSVAMKRNCTVGHPPWCDLLALLAVLVVGGSGLR